MDQILLKKNWLILVLFTATFIGDTLTSLLLRNEYNFSWVLKGLTTILIIAFLLRNDRSNLRFILIGYIMSIVGAIFNYQADIIPRTALFFEYYSGILLFIFLVKNNQEKLIEQILTLIFLFYVINITIVVIFRIDYFKTYSLPDRFGYLPFFSSQNEFSYIVICLLSFFYKKLTLSKTKINYVFFILSLFAASCVGTKVIYLFIVILLNFILYKRLGAIKYLSFTFIFCSINIYLYEFWLKFLNKYFKVMVKVYEEKGFLDTMSSLRLSYLEDRLLCQYSNFEFINYFFGGSVLNCITEMSFIDLLLFFGIIGFLWFFFSIKKLILNYLRLDCFGYLFISSIVLLSFVGGYYFENFSPQLYAVSFLYLFYYNQRNLPQSKVLEK